MNKFNNQFRLKRKLICNNKLHIFIKITTFLIVIGMMNVFTTSAYSRTKLSEVKTAFVKPFIKGVLQQQKTTISGKVTNKAGEVMVGVTVSIKGTTRGVSTDVNGNYSISLKTGDKILVFSFIGMSKKEVAIGAQTEINVMMEIETSTLDEVVVVGYGTQKKITLTGAIDNVTAKQLENRSVPNVVALLQGQMAGVTVIKKSSQPGAPQLSIRIRGEGTLGNNEPLILIDGVPGDINSVNPDDIENVTVLKDAASTAIYGVRASGGVLLFTTKKGKKNQPLKVTASGYFGLQTTTRDPKFVGTADYMRLRNEARVNVGMQKLYTDNDILSVENGTADPAKFAQTNWVKEIYKKAAPIQNYSLTIQGGSDRATYFMSYGYLNHEGIAISNKYQQVKHNLRANFSAEIIKNVFTLEENIAYNLGVNNTPAAGNDPIYTALKMPTIAPIYNKFGNYVPTLGNRNPIAEITDGGNSSYNWNDVVLTTTAKFDIAKGITAKAIYSAYRATGIGKSFAEKYKYYDSNNNFFSFNRLDAQISQNADQNGSNDITIQGDFNRTFNDHTVTAVLGMNQDDGKWQQFTASKSGFATNELDILNAGNLNPIVGGTANHFALRSRFARVGENYKNKYYLEALVRQDMTSRFASDNRTGTFYAFSGSWRLLEENFMKSLKGNILNEFKLRGSYGSVGNQNVGGTLYPTYVELSIYNNIWPLGNTVTSGYGQNILPNMNIRWETSYMTNIGSDILMFKNKLSVSGDIYWKKTKDIIRNPVLPAVVGLGQASVNMGVVKSKGWELSLGWKDTKGDWNYSFKFNLADASNKIISLGGTSPILGDALVKEGAEMNALYGYRVDHIAQEADFTYNPVSGKKVPKFASPAGWFDAGLVNPGDLIYKDLNHDGVITPDDREVIGSMQPRYTFALNANVAWKNFDFSLLLQGIGKVDGYVYSEAMHPFISNYAQPQIMHLGRWTPEHPDASYPRLTEGMNYNSGLFSDYWLQDASYLRVKNIAVGYTISDKWIKHLGISKCHIYVSAENLFTISNYFYAFDPETILNNGSFYPQLKTVYLGFNLTF